MPIWLIPAPGDSSKPLKALRYCFRVWRVNSGCKTHAQPGWCFHVCRLFSNFSFSCCSFPPATSSSSMRPESFHIWQPLLHLKILREIFKVEKPQGENYKTHHTIHMDKTRNSLGVLCILHFSTPSPVRKAWNFYEVLDQPKGVQRRLNF